MTTISICISAGATVVIAYFAWQSHKMYRILQEKDEDYKKQTRDLYQAIVISTLLSGPSSYGGYETAKKLFKEEYAGETKIFKD